MKLMRDAHRKLLLRVYGPNVAHLIDRDSELAILRRLAQKNIGPRLLGTFANGRFEEFFHARALTPQELRNPETSMQIAKRMRELHDGIELETKEIEAGPFVWQNWDKWVARCEKIVQALDTKTAQDSKTLTNGASESSKSLPVCGTEWKIFRTAVEKYRRWLQEKYGGNEQIKQRLVFAHNDVRIALRASSNYFNDLTKFKTQYGNILRYIPQGDSPLLRPANKHKQLVVIDFEYANANLPGLEFANHFVRA
jgi:choline kinase